MSQAATTDSIDQRLQRWLVGLYLLLHLGLFGFNLVDPIAVLRGDRGEYRFLKAVALEQGGFAGLRDTLLQLGMPGDYLLHSLIYLVGGIPLLLPIQMLVGLLTLLWTLRLARLLGASPVATGIVGLLLTLLPASLMHPHQYVTETFCAAAITYGALSLARYLRESRLRLLWSGFLGLTLATWLRPQAALLVALAAALLWIWKAAPRPQLVMASVVAALLSIGSWVGWRYTQTCEIGLGPADFDLAVNFKLRADRIANIDGIPGWRNADLADGTDLRMSGGEFLALAEAHPKAAAKTYATDAVNLVANPGANAFLGMFLKVLKQHTDHLYWKKFFDKEGPVGVFKAVVSEPAFLFGMLGYGLLHLLFYGLAGWGLLDPRAVGSLPRARLLLIGLTVALLLGAFLSGIVRWTHRAPVEPLIAVVAALALTALLQRGAERKARVSAA